MVERAVDLENLTTGVLADEERTRARDDTGAQLTTEEQEQASGLLSGAGELPLGEVVRRGGRRTIGVLFLLNFVDEFDRAAFGILGPDIQRSLNLTDLTLALAGTLSGFMVVVAAVPIGVLGDRRSRVRLISLFSALWAVFGLLTGLARTALQLVGARLLSGIGKANEGPLQKPVLADAYPIAGRGRIFALHDLAKPVGAVLGTAATGGIVVAIGGPEAWRWVFVLMALPALSGAVLALLVREPERGRNEQVEVLGAAPDVDRSEVEAERISLSAAFARLKKIRTFYYGLVGLGATGFGLFTGPIFLNLILEREFGLDAGGRGVVGAITSAGGLVGAGVGGLLSDRLAQRSPERVLQLAGLAVGLLAVALPLSVLMPTVTLYTVVGFMASVFLGAAVVPAVTVFAAALPFRLRSTGFALVGIYMAVLGGVAGAVVSGLISSAHGPRAAIVVLVPPTAILGGILFARGARFVVADMALVAADIEEEAAERVRIAAGGEIPILQIRNLDVSYGPVQVLFGVDLDVHEGEILALLGTNGAGKSTVLRAVSGLNPTDRGVIRFRGRDLTFTDPGTRVRAGIVQMAGGRAVFGEMSVRDNLRAGAFTLDGDVDEAIRRALLPFPVLVERLDQPAGSLSGGEQQMLGLAKAMLLEPELLIIDELSLGLAPTVVQQLLRIVEELRASGTTILIVEQSVNVALGIADRAVFMEKGQVHFEGAAAELAERDDLLRAVFLGGERS